MGADQGYLLPDGNAYTGEMECAIVYYPAKAEYRRALLGSLSFLATWRAWERDSEKRGKDAALAWSEALELTMGCWNMTCIETLITNQEWMIEWMATHSLDCCEGTTYGDTTIIITVITPFIGDPPAFYGETAISSWEEWQEHLCFNAHAWVDLLIENALVLETGLFAGGVGMGMLAYALAAIAFIGTGGLLAIPVIMLGAASLATLEGSGIFSDAADDLEVARDDIVCALISGLDVAEAVEDALGSGVAWDTVFSLLNYDTPTAILYEGEGLEGYLSSETSDACDCAEPINLNGWTLVNAPSLRYDATKGAPACEYGNSRLWNDFIKPVGEPNFWGDITIRGNVRITGFMTEHANCSGAGSLWLEVYVCVQSTATYNHSCTVSKLRFFSQVGNMDGVVDLLLPFEYILTVGNAHTVSLSTWANWRYGDIDVTMNTEVNFLEIV